MISCGVSNNRFQNYIWRFFYVFLMMIVTAIYGLTTISQIIIFFLLQTVFYCWEVETVSLVVRYDGVAVCYGVLLFLLMTSFTYEIFRPVERAWFDIYYFFKGQITVFYNSFSLLLIKKIFDYAPNSTNFKTSLIIVFFDDL